MKLFVLISLVWGNAFSQCCEFGLVRKDSIFKKPSIVVLEPKPGFQARVIFEPLPAVVVDNTDPRIIYNGAWYNGSTTATGFSNNTHAHSMTAGNYFTFQFTGIKIEWIAEQKTGMGRAGVTIDAKPEEIIPLNLSNVGNGVVKSWTLEPGLHTIKIRVMDAKYVVSDGFNVQ